MTEPVIGVLIPTNIYNDTIEIVNCALDNKGKFWYYQAERGGDVVVNIDGFIDEGLYCEGVYKEDEEPPEVEAQLIGNYNY